MVAPEQVAEEAKKTAAAATGAKARKAAAKGHLMEDAAEGGAAENLDVEDAGDQHHTFHYFDDYARHLDYLGSPPSPLS